MTISICIICLNEERNIKRCLESSKWANEIIVVDSMSQDRTVEIAKEYTDKVYQRAWSTYTDQKNFALSKATGDWIFSIDADEEISQDLQAEVRQEVKKEMPRMAIQCHAFLTTKEDGSNIAVFIRIGSSGFSGATGDLG
jgi:glycosyltransferase involved in cell wall biosynthesis